MMKKDNLTLVAVGSNSLVAAELHRILRSILKLPLPIKEAITAEIKKDGSESFYICANTQGPTLAKIVHDSSLFVFDLQPTTKFFLDIAQIPAGENVLVFNNRTEYAQLLINKCHELGINQLNFEAAAYEELPESVLQEKLSNARYIIGVEVFTGRAVLQSEKYKPYLRPDVKIISGQRTASVASASQLLKALSEYYYLYYAMSLTLLTMRTPSPYELNKLSQNLQRVVTALQQSALQSVTLQITGQSQNQPAENKQHRKIEACTTANAATIKKQLEQLDFLIKRFTRLMH